MTKAKIGILLAASALCAPLAFGANTNWKPAAGPLMTRWAKDVSPDNALPEYPRPQLVRKDWQNLNGLWDYAITPKAAAQPAAWDGKILVPFPVESALSGVMKGVSENDRLWYRRTFTVPRGWQKQRVLLHFGAVDWEATVFVNGRELGTHRGGYDAFSFDITDALKPGGEQEIVVSVFDPTDAGTQPRGKQVRKPEGIFYTASSGIWQTAWLEPVNAAHIDHLKIVPNVDDKSANIEVGYLPGSGKNEFRIEVLDGEKVIQSNSGTVDETGRNIVHEQGTLVAKLAKPKLWSPDSPFLYGLRVTLLSNGKKVDQIESYFGMRKIALGTDAQGIQRLMLNNAPLFEFGPLDQGFWPDGLYTAPTDAALRYDIEMTKRLGFNLARKHVKVEPERWYYWCDKLGLLVWQDMPSGDKSIGGDKPDLVRLPESAAQYEVELKALIEGRCNHPSIVMWVTFNEGWGQFDTARIAGLVKQWDATRLVNSASGGVDRQAGDVRDIHNYPAPAAAALEKNRAVVLGEFGGLGQPVPEHLWQGSQTFSYQGFQASEQLTSGYLGLMRKLHPLTGAGGLAAAVYTQTTDVEGEVNGLMTYDRALVKMNEAKITAFTKAIIAPGNAESEKLFVAPKMSVVVPAADTQSATWRYTTTKPATNWAKVAFDDATWSQGQSGFGTQGTPGARIGTVWNTPDIWLRREVEIPADKLKRVELWLHHDKDAQIYVNGVRATREQGYTSEYSNVTLSDDAKAALQPGKNLVAIHCHQTEGGQYIDAGFVVEETGN